MEAIALLCTLHADGPATLRRLRASGCDSLEALEHLSVEELSQLLRSTPAVARRLAREARILRQRVAEDPLEREEAPEGMTRGAAVEGSSGTEFTPETEFTESTLDEVDQELLSRVLDTVPSVPFAEAVPEAVLESALQAPDPEPQSSSEPIQPVRLLATDLDGLDEELCMQLAAEGIRDLAALGAADCDSLAQATRRSFAHLRRLQFLAQRALPGKPMRLAPRRGFGAGLGSLLPEPQAKAPQPEAQPAAPQASEPVGKAAPGPAPFGANLEPRVVPTRERLEAPGMEHPVPAPPPPSPRRFWEPRSLYEARTARGTTRSAAAATPKSPAPGPAPQPAPAPAVAPAVAPLKAAAEPAAESISGSVTESAAEKPLVLSWDFEIPMPGRAPEPPLAADQGPGQDGQREDAAGPFA